MKSVVARVVKCFIFNAMLWQGERANGDMEKRKEGSLSGNILMDSKLVSFFCS